MEDFGHFTSLSIMATETANIYWIRTGSRVMVISRDIKIYVQYLIASFVHFGHGILSFYLWAPDQEKQLAKDDEAMQQFAQAGPSQGLINTLFAALAFEIVENTEFLINRFRENSGQKPML